MKHWFLRLMTLLLALSLVVSLAACGGGGESSQSQSAPGGSSSESEKDTWENVNFGGEELHIEVSANQDYEVTFPPADIYTKGPDSLNEDPVQKKVYDRNLTVASMLTTLRDMMGFLTFDQENSGLMGAVTPKDIAQLNRLLSRVKK